MSQLRSDIWCAAFIRLHNDRGNFCVVAKKGHEVAGQIWIELDHLDNSISLFSPAPMLKYDAEKYQFERVFECRLSKATPEEVKSKIAQELDFDPDIWVIALEMRNSEQVSESKLGINII